MSRARLRKLVKQVLLYGNIDELKLGIKLKVLKRINGLLKTKVRSSDIVINTRIEQIRRAIINGQDTLPVLYKIKKTPSRKVQHSELSEKSM